VGYAALIDSGCALMGLGLNSQVGVTLVFLSLMVRPLGLTLMASGLSGVWARDRDDSLGALEGRGWRAPWSTAAFVVGGLSMAGWPLGAGFGWRWAQVRALSSSSPGSALMTLLAGAAVAIAVWRGVGVLMRRPRTAEGLVAPFSLSSEKPLTAAVVLALILGCVWIGLFPQVIGPVAASLAEGYTFFLP
jgi:multicomponent Na+:H+ antiporter subunit D